MKLTLLLLSAILMLTAQAKELKEKIVNFLPLNQTLDVYKSDGSSSKNTTFRRQSLAYTKDFKSIPANKPYFLDGGVFLGNGVGYPKALERGTVNYLEPNLASLDVTDGLKITGKASKVSGIEGKGAIKLDGSLNINMQYPHDGIFIFSFYLKGGEIKVSLNDKEIKTFKGSDTFKRYFVMLPNNKVKSPLNITMVGKDATIDAMMLEGNIHYYARRQKPSLWIPGQAKRYSDTLLLPINQTLVNKGAIALKFTPRDICVWNCLASTKSWGPELDLNIKNYGRIINANFWGKSFVVHQKVTLQAGKEYSLIMTWNDKKGVLYLDGKKIGETPIVAVDKRKLPLNIAIGGTPDSTSPNIKAEGVIKDFIVFDDFINDEEAKKIATSNMKSLLSVVPVQNLVPVNNFARDTKVATLAWASKKKIDNVIIQLGNLPVESAKVKNNQILWHFSPEKMLPQSYPLTLKITFADKIQQTLKSTNNIFPARTPWKNLQISTWN